MPDNLQVSTKPKISSAQWKDYGLAVFIKYPEKLHANLYVVDNQTGNTHEYRVYSAWLEGVNRCLS